jgi:hypothetical protein
MTLLVLFLFLAVFPRDALAGEQEKKKRGLPKRLITTEKLTACYKRIPAPWKIPGPGDAPVPAFLVGSVTLAQGKLEIRADAMVIWIAHAMVDTPDGPKKRTIIYEFYAEGNVHITDGTDFIMADRMYYNTETDRGLLDNVRTRTTRMNLERYRRGRVFDEFEEPPELGPRANVALFMRAKELRAKGANVYEARGAQLSTCSFAEPHWGLTSNLIKSTPTGELAASGNMLWQWGLPLPLPAMRVEKDFRPPIRRVRFLYSSNFGHAFLSEWNLLTRKSFDLCLVLDDYSKRGTGWGVKARYGSKNLKRNSYYGMFETYLLRDEGEDVDGTPLDDPSRYRVRLAHRQMLPWDVKLEAEASKISDENFLRYFFASEYSAGKEQETYVFLKKVNRNCAGTLFAKAQFNDFYNRTEYLPEGSLYLFGENLGFGIYLDSDLHASYAGRAFSSNLDNEGFHKGRFCWDKALCRPIHLGRFLTLTPFAKMYLAGWTDSYYSVEQPDGVMRAAMDCGVTAATEFGRIYDFSSKTLDIHRLRHIIRPEVRWSRGIFNTLPPEYLQPIDDMEELDMEHKITLSLANILQTRRKMPTDGKKKKTDMIVDVAKLELEIPFFPDEDADKPGEYFGCGEAELELIPLRCFALESTCVYDPGERKVTAVSSGIRLTLPPVISLYTGGRYEWEKKRLFVAEMGFTPTKKWDFLYTVETDLTVPEYRRRAVLVHRHFHQWVLEVGYDVRYGEPKSDRAFFICFIPAALVKSRPKLFRSTTGDYGPRF